MGEPKRILIVEDDDMLRNIECDMLGCLIDGARVDGAVSPEVALALVEGTNYDLIVVDYRFKGSELDGLTLIRFLREGGYKAKIIFMTGSETSVLRDGIDAGANVALRKPVTMADIQVRLQQLQLL